MGYSRWDNKDWDRYSAGTRGKSTSQIFNASSMKPDMDPRHVKLRESRDSAANPASTPIILALDVTGSMGMIADALAREGLGTLVEAILDRKPVTDPHIMVMGVGDSFYDRAPLQVSQFEADIKIAEQLKEIFLEHGGGGNNHESYTLPWYFAAQKTDIDCVKHGRKGILFTFGDEQCPPDIRADHIRRVLGDEVPGNISTKDLLDTVSQKYDVFHVVIEQGNYAQSHKQEVYDSWKKVLPEERIISVKDYRQLPAILVSVMEVHAGKNKDDVANSWQGETVAVVKDAIKNVKPDGKAPGVKVMSPLKLKPSTPPKAA